MTMEFPIWPRLISLPINCSNGHWLIAITNKQTSCFFFFFQKAVEISPTCTEVGSKLEIREALRRRWQSTYTMTVLRHYKALGKSTNVTIFTGERNMLGVVLYVSQDFLSWSTKWRLFKSNSFPPAVATRSSARRLGCTVISAKHSSTSADHVLTSRLPRPHKLETRKYYFVRGLPTFPYSPLSSQIPFYQNRNTVSQNIRTFILQVWV